MTWLVLFDGFDGKFAVVILIGQKTKTEERKKERKKERKEVDGETKFSCVR